MPNNSISLQSTLRMLSLGAVLAASSTVVAGPISGQGTWETTLQERDLNGDGVFDAYYDTTLDITWLRDANAGAGSSFDDGFNSTDGRMTWASANAWAAALDVFGITGWRLPTVAPISGGTSFNTAFSNNATTDLGYADADGWVDGTTGTPVSEMGHMYYVTLGNLGFCTPNDTSPGDCSSQSGWELFNTAEFLNVQSNSYWSGSELSASSAWNFGFFSGTQGNFDEGNFLFAWAVRSGDVSVPAPGVLGLLGIGLAGMLAAGRGRRRADLALR